MPRLTKFLSVVLSGLLLSACAGTGRFAGVPGFERSGPPRAVAAPMEPAPGAPLAQSGAVVSEPLPPPSYPGGAPAPAQTTIAGLPEPGEEPPLAAPPRPASPSQPSPGSAGSAVGGWTARDATGATCRVTLSSAPALDLNKASAGGCANRDLQKVNAWKQQGGEIYLYAAGAVVARLPAGGRAMSGVLARSGAPVTLTR